jgi:hypothetical protein
MASADGSDSIVVTDVRTDGRRVEYDYGPSPDVRRFLGEEFAVEYDVNVSEVPESILVMLLVANLCPVAWATGADVYAPRIDGTLLRALPSVREQFERGNWHLGADERFMWRDIQPHADRSPDFDRDDAGEACSSQVRGECPYPEAADFFRWPRNADIDALAARSTDADSTDSMRNRALYAVARHTSDEVYSPLYSAYSNLDERLSG